MNDLAALAMSVVSQLGDISREVELPLGAWYSIGMAAGMVIAFVIGCITNNLRGKKS